MNCFKLLGERAIAYDFGHQVAELQVRAVSLKHFMRLRASMTVAMQ